MIFVFSRLFAQKKKLLFLLVWIPVVTLVFSVFRRDDVLPIGVELCGFDGYMLFQESFVFLVAVGIPTLFFISSSRLYDVHAVYTLHYRSRRRLCLTQALASFAVCFAVSVYLVFCVFLISRFIFPTAYNWMEEGSQYWYQTRELGPEVLSEGVMVLSTALFSFLLLCLNTLLFDLAEQWIPFRGAAWFVVLFYTLLSDRGILSSYMPSALILMGYSDYSAMKFPLVGYGAVLLILFWMTVLLLLKIEVKDFYK